MLLIQLRRNGAYSENKLFGAARVLRPDLPRRLPRSPRKMLRKALCQLAWSHLKAVVVRPARGSSAQPRALAIDASVGDITGAIAVQPAGHLPPV